MNDKALPSASRRPLPVSSSSKTPKAHLSFQQRQVPLPRRFVLSKLILSFIFRLIASSSFPSSSSSPAHLPKQIKFFVREARKPLKTCLSTHSECWTHVEKFPFIIILLTLLDANYKISEFRKVRLWGQTE